MGREVRKVPATWEHPKDETGGYIPLYGRSFSKALFDWNQGKEKWAQGFRDDYNGGWKIKEREYKEMGWEEWYGDVPIQSDYMPDWDDSERTHLQMYEDTTEGTPISPPMETPEQLARWLADNNASAMGGQTATYDQWLNMIGDGWAPSMIFTPSTGLISGVEGTTKLKD